MPQNDKSLVLTRVFPTLLLLCMLSPAAFASDFGVSVTHTPASQEQYHTDASTIKLHNLDDFDGEVNVEVIPPAGSHIDAFIKGETSTTLKPNNQEVDVMITPRRKTPAGDYEVTVRVTGTKDGKTVTREATIKVRVTQPKEFNLEVTPIHITIVQGGSGNVAAILKRASGNRDPIDLSLSWTALADGISAKFAGDGQLLNSVYGIPKWWTDNSKSESRTDIEIQTSTNTAPGTYSFRVEATGVRRYEGLQSKQRTLGTGRTRSGVSYIKSERYWEEIEIQNPVTYGAPFKVTVIAKPEDEEPMVSLPGEEPQVSLTDPTTRLDNFGPTGAEDAWSGAEELDQIIRDTCGELLSEPADTIACSVHTFKKPDTSEPPENPDVTIGNSTEVPDKAGGGHDTEVFVRNPDDNNLRQGCGDLDPGLISLPGGNPVFQNPDPIVIGVSCNEVAKGKKKPRKAILRKHRDQVNVNLDDRKQADHDRREKRKQVKMDASNQHLIIREVVGDAVIQGPNTVSCPKTPKKKGQVEYVDPKFKDVPDSVKTLVTGGQQIKDSSEAFEQIKGGMQAVDGADKTLTNLGVKFDSLNKLNEAIKFTDKAADMTYTVQSGKQVSMKDVKEATEAVAGFTGNKHISTVSKGFEALSKVEELRLKLKDGKKLETKDIRELAEKLNDFRGDRFKGMGEVLDGITAHTKNIEKAESLFKDLEKVSQFLDKADYAQRDPVKAAELFGEYLDMMGSVASKVPGMGELVQAYAQAVKNMQGNIQTLDDYVTKRNKAIKAFDEAVEGYDYDSMLEDADDFSSDLAEGGGTKLSADSIAIAHDTAGLERDMNDKEHAWKENQRCIIRSNATLNAIKKYAAELDKERKSLPSQKELQADLTRASFFDTYRGYLKQNPAAMPSQRQAENMGFESPQRAKKALEDSTGVQAGQAVIKARERLGFRDFSEERAKELHKQYQKALDELKECRNRAKTLQIEYWQAVRDYVARYSYLVGFVEKRAQGMGQRGRENRARALTALDQQIALQGFQVIDGRVEVKIVSDCEEEKKVYSVGR